MAAVKAAITDRTKAIFVESLANPGGVVTDLEAIAKIADERSPDALDEAVNQIAFADTILLNKIDLVSPEELQTARDIVRSVNMTANLIECQLADPPPMVFEKEKGEKGEAGGSAADATPAAAEEDEEALAAPGGLAAQGAARHLAAWARSFTRHTRCSTR